MVVVQCPNIWNERYLIAVCLLLPIMLFPPVSTINGKITSEVCSYSILFSRSHFLPLKVWLKLCYFIYKGYILPSRLPKAISQWVTLQLQDRAHECRTFDKVGHSGALGLASLDPACICLFWVFLSPQGPVTWLASLSSPCHHWQWVRLLGSIEKSGAIYYFLWSQQMLKKKKLEKAWNGAKVT